MTIYDIYEQNEQAQDIIGIRKITRYHTENKAMAFYWMNEKNRLAGKNIWRVAEQKSDRIYFDIDNEDIINVSLIKEYYDTIFGDLIVLKTYHGYHLLSEVYKDKDKVQWQYDTCRVLNPFLEPCHLQKYIEAIKRFYNTERDKQKIEGLDKIEFTEYLPKKLKESGLYFGIGDFDILFALNVIMKEYYCIRISKKSIDDIPQLIILP